MEHIQKVSVTYRILRIGIVKLVRDYSKVRQSQLEIFQSSNLTLKMRVAVSTLKDRL